MNKNKRLVEFEKDVYNAIKKCSLNANGHCGRCPYRGVQNPDCQSCFVARILDKEGYRKITKKSAFPTKEEYNGMIDPKVVATLRRSTAIEILSCLVVFASRSLKRGCIEEADFDVLFNNIARRYGVEVEE